MAATQNRIKTLAKYRILAALLLLCGLAAPVPRAYAQGGVPLWTNRYNDAEFIFAEPIALGADLSGNVFVTGYAGSGSYHFATVAYSGQGDPLWTNRYYATLSRTG